MGKAGIEKTSKRDQAIRTVVQTAALMVILTLGSKLFGFVREMVFAAYFGAGYVMDAYSMAQSIPKMLFSGILQAVSLSFLPLFSEKAEQEGIKSGNEFLVEVINLLLRTAVLLGVLGIVFSDGLVKIFAHGFKGEQATLTVFFLKIGFIYFAFSACSELLKKYLEYKGMFLRPIVFGYLQNVIIIFFAIAAAFYGEKILIFGPFFAYLVFAIVLGYLTAKEGVQWKFSFKSSKAAKQIIWLAFPTFVSSYLASINSFVDKAQASTLPEGSVASLGYAVTIIGFIMGLTTSIIATLITPKMNQARAKGEIEAYNALLSRGFNLTAMISIPCGFALMLFSNEIVQVLYERGAFDELATATTAIALFWYGPYLCFVQLNNHTTITFLSNKDTKTPMWISLVAVTINVTLNLILVRKMGIGGIALATSIGTAISLIMSVAIFEKKYKNLRIIESYKKLCLISIAAAVSVLIAKGLYIRLVEAVWMPRACYLGIVALVAMIIYYIILVKTGMEEMALLKGILMKKEKVKG